MDGEKPRGSGRLHGDSGKVVLPGLGCKTMERDLAPPDLYLLRGTGFRAGTDRKFLARGGFVGGPDAAKRASGSFLPVFDADPGGLLRLLFLLEARGKEPTGSLERLDETLPSAPLGDFQWGGFFAVAFSR